MYFDQRIIERALTTYPNLPLEKACIKVLQENMTPAEPTNHTPQPEPTKPCGSCGGGKVL